MYTLYINFLLSMNQDVELHMFFQQINTPSGNWLTCGYFHSVTSCDTCTLTSFTALIHGYHTYHAVAGTIMVFGEDMVCSCWRAI